MRTEVRWTCGGDYTFLNERLARHYGIPSVSGPEYRRVTWPGPERAGLLAHGGILTLTSYPYNAYPVDAPTTSPAQRAKWIRTRFLGVSPPATLFGVPAADFPFEKHTPLVKQSRTFPARLAWRVIGVSSRCPMGWRTSTFSDAGAPIMVPVPSTLLE